MAQDFIKSNFNYDINGILDITKVNEKKDDAVQVIKGRGRFISTCWQRTWMSCEGLMKRLCAPRSDFAKQVA